MCFGIAGIKVNLLQNAQKTVENQEKIIYDQLRKERLIHGPLALTENNSKLEYITN